MGPIPNHLVHLTKRVVDVASHPNSTDIGQPPSHGAQSWTGSFTGSGVDLIAMVVSDSGLADEEPKWNNAAPLACFLIGVQPRGGWQVMQRAVQWGDDPWTRAFGVHCEAPVLYAYFACSMRNRIEVWNSPHFWSPMENVAEAGQWTSTSTFAVKRPTKLIDGSRGGQAFICDVLRPADDKHYSIKQQSHAQLLSVMLVAAALMDTESQEELENVMKKDFNVGPQLSSVFRRLIIGIIITNILALIFATTIFASLWRYNIYKESLSYAIKASSLFIWAVGASGLLMLGGNPRVEIVEQKVPPHIASRLEELATSIDGEIQAQSEKEENTATKITAKPIAAPQGSEEITTISTSASTPTVGKPKLSPIELAPVTLRFGSLHGSVYTADQGECVLPFHVLRRVCSWDLRFKRTKFWYMGICWFSTQLLLSIIMQITGYGTSTVGAEAMSIGFLLITSLARGSGLSGSEEWMIPRWKRRSGTRSGAQLIGRVQSRQ